MITSLFAFQNDRIELPARSNHDGPLGTVALGFAVVDRPRDELDVGRSGVLGVGSYLLVDILLCAARVRSRAESISC